ncbi:MAG: hypothetical protein ABJE47_21100 [bacterium]
MNTPMLQVNALGPITADGVAAMNVMWPEIEPTLRAFARRIAKDPANVDVLLADAMEKFWFLDATRYDFRRRGDSGYAVRALINHMKNRWHFADHGPLTLSELVGSVAFGGRKLKPDPHQLD